MRELDLGTSFQLRRDEFDADGTRRTVRGELHRDTGCLLKLAAAQSFTLDCDSAACRKNHAAAEASSQECEDVLDKAHPTPLLDAKKKPMAVEYIAVATGGSAKAYAGAQVGKFLAPIDSPELAAVALYFALGLDACYATDLKADGGGFSRSYEFPRSRGGGICGKVEHHVERVSRAGVVTTSRWFDPPRRGPDCWAMSAR
jgi:hypothetical protein